MWIPYETDLVEALDAVGREFAGSVKLPLVLAPTSKFPILPVVPGNIEITMRLLVGD